MYVSSVRYSVNRKKEFQIKTIIFEEDNVKYVSKEPYSNEAIQHIKDMQFNFELLKNSSLNLVIPTLYHNKIIFPFVEGENFASVLIKQIIDGNINEFKERLLWYKSILMNGEQVQFYETSAFKNVFGDGSLLIGMPSLKISNIDLNFENIIIGKDERLTIIDYEWVFKFPIPFEYILYRVICIFVTKFSSYLNNIISIEEIFNLLEIDSNKLEVYLNMEQSLVKYVGKDWLNYREKYYKPLVRKETLDFNHSILLTTFDQKEILQIFWDANRGFNEGDSDSLMIRKYNNFETYEFELPITSLNNIRIDPGSLPAYIEMKITLYYNEEIINLTNNITSSDGVIFTKMNSDFLKLVSISNDPQLIIENDILLKEGQKILKISLCYSSKIEDYLTNLHEEYKKLITIRSIQKEKLRIIKNDYQEVILEKENLLSINGEYKDLLVIQEEQIERITDIYQKTISTKGWKVLEFMRKLKFK